MQIIPLIAEPNQEFTATLENSRWAFRFKLANNVMVADITVDDVVLVQASRVLAGEPLIPYQYLEEGNFIVITEGEALPDYAQFGVTQTLVYLSAAELAAL